MPKGKQNVGCVLPEFALDNLGASFKVILVESVICYDSQDGREFYIPDYQGLIKKIAVTRAAHPAKLAGRDIKFLRKSLSLKAKDLASKLDITPEHLSRCETGDKILSPNSEKVLRSLVMFEAIFVLRKALEDTGLENQDLLGEISKLLEKMQHILEGLSIQSVRSADEEIVFHFRREPKCKDHAADNDGEPLEWLDEAA